MRQDDGPVRPGAIRPLGLHDLRAGPVPGLLRYGPADVVVVTGLPGAGKSTLMARCARAPMIDSQHVRERYQARLPSWVPYPVLRPFVRLAHYLRLAAALRAGGPLMVHDCGTVPVARSWLVRTARRQGRQVHLLVIDAEPDAARDGQRARGRQLSHRAFARHVAMARRSRELLLAAAAPPPGWASAVLIGREGACGLGEIVFRPGETPDDRARGRA